MSGATKADRGPLGGRQGRALARDLALTKTSQSELAEKYGVSQPAISQFKERRAEEIAAIAANADDQYAGMWIADKQARLAEYERLHEIALTPTPKIDIKGKIVKDIDPITHEEVVIVEMDGGLAAKVLKQAAEEMGQLPTRLQIQGDMQTTTTYRFENVDPDALT